MTDMISKEQAESLAVVYAAWCQANRNSDDLGIFVSGHRLLDMQKETGIIMRKEDLIKALVSNSAKLLDEREKKGAA